MKKLAALISLRGWPSFLSWLQGWHIHYGSWWMFQWCFDRWISIGIHIDFATRTAPNKVRYGPYIDIHLPCMILSLGRNPAHSCNLESVISISRGGIS